MDVYRRDVMRFARMKRWDSNPTGCVWRDRRLAAMTNRALTAKIPTVSDKQGNRWSDRLFEES